MHIVICDICGDEITGHSNNAEPVVTGRCCDLCNTEWVIPSRIVLAQWQHRALTHGYKHHDDNNAQS
jgi:hypothetical protein